MTALLAAALMALGVATLLSAFGAGARDGAAPSRAGRRPDPVDLLRRWLVRTGLEEVGPGRFLAVSAAVGGVVGLLVVVLLGSGPLAVLGAAGAAVLPASLWRRRARRLEKTTASMWPRLLEELRVRTGGLGRPIPQALVEVGLNGPAELRPAFAAAGREWSLTTDFARTVRVLKDRLDDPTTDAVCETLVVAHEVGGDIDARLAALAEDRRRDQRFRQEAEARQAGARVARWFVIVVPAGMGFAGLQLGDGTGSFDSAPAQAAAIAAVAMIAGCWWWAGRMMHMPTDRRVLDR